jgi:hypothetical protein
MAHECEDVVARKQEHITMGMLGVITDLPEPSSRAPTPQNNGKRHTVTKIIPSTPTKYNELAATYVVMY